MQHKMNPAVLQKILNSAHGDLSSALSYLMDIVIVSNPGSARTGLHEMLVQFEQMLGQTMMLKRRIRRWAHAFPEHTEATREESADFLAEFFDFHAEAEDAAEDADDDESMAEPGADDADAFDADKDGDGAMSPDEESAPFALSDADLARLFDISEASATAGVRETGYVDIFGAWIEGRRPGPYKRPPPPQITDDPDYNVPGEGS